MARKIQKILVAFGLVGGAALFQTAGCDSFTSEFLSGIQSGYTSVTGTNLFEDIGKELAGDLGGSSTNTSSNTSSWGNSTPYAYAYSGFQPSSYWGW